MPKKKEWIGSNKMRFESLHKEFNRQTNIISNGQMIANTQYSMCIRAHSETINPIGERRDPGFLQDFDLKIFKEVLRLSIWVEEKIKEYLKKKSGILYCFKHHNIRGRTIDGFALTDGDYNLIDYWIVGRTYKARSAVKEALKYIANGPREGLGYGEIQ